MSTEVFPHLSPDPVVGDLDCRLGLSLCDMYEYSPKTTLYCCDITPAMIEYGQQLLSPFLESILGIHGLSTGATPRWKRGWLIWH